VLVKCAHYLQQRRPTRSVVYVSFRSVRASAPALLRHLARALDALLPPDDVHRRGIEQYHQQYQQHQQQQQQQHQQHQQQQQSQPVAVSAESLSSPSPSSLPSSAHPPAPIPVPVEVEDAAYLALHAVADMIDMDEADEMEAMGIHYLCQPPVQVYAHKISYITTTISQFQ
jgi:hypothetical protein